MNLIRKTRTFLVRERTSAPVTQVIVQERVSRRVYIPVGLRSDDGRGAYLPPGDYASIKQAVREIRFSDQAITDFGKDPYGWFCAITNRYGQNDGQAHYGIDLTQGCITFRGFFPRRRTRVVQKITLRRTFWR